MSTINPDEIISILKEEIENYDEISKNQEVGTVISVGDGIATVYGIDHAMYGEVVVFENGLKGMVQDIRTNSMGCILFGSDSGIREGSKVSRTGRQAGIPVGNGFIGRIVNALGVFMWQWDRRLLLLQRLFPLLKNTGQWNIQLYFPLRQVTVRLFSILFPMQEQPWQSSLCIRGKMF